MPASTRRRRKLVIFTAIAVLTIAALILSDVASAFKIRYAGVGKPVHEEITDKALQAATLAADKNPEVPFWGFTAPTRKKISEYAAKVDISTGFGFLDPHRHFDNNLLFEGAQVIQVERPQIIFLISRADALYRAGNKPGGDIVAGLAQNKLGILLHTIQDFYAHSNWAETGRKGEAGLGVFDKVATNPMIGEARAECVCGSPPILQDSGLATSYFFLTDRGASQAANEGKCIHNEAYDEFDLAASCAESATNPFNYSLYPILPGTDKDQPGRPWPKREYEQESLHERAKGKAVLESAAFAQGILLEARELDLNLGICGFLGYDTASACLAQSPIHMYEQELPFFRVGDTYYTDEIFTFDVALFDSSLGRLEAVRTEWSAEFSGTGTCPEEPSQIESAADQCLFIRAIRDFSISTPNPDVAYQWLYCNTSFGDPTLTNPYGRSDTCGISTLFFGTPGIFDSPEWPGGVQSFEKTGVRTSRFIAGGSFCGLCTDVAGSSIVRIDGTFVSRLTGYLGIDNPQGTFFPSTSPFVEFQGTMKIKLLVTYEYSTVPETIGSPLTRHGGASE